MIVFTLRLKGVIYYPRGFLWRKKQKNTDDSALDDQKML